MKQQNYQSSITTNMNAEGVYNNIARVNEWWAKNFEGSALNLGDSFTVKFGTTWVNFEITAAQPNEKIVWKVIDCFLPWLKDKTEWNNTEIIWEMENHNGVTTVQMTHKGLSPVVECFETCQKGWNEYISGSLFKLLNEGVGMPG